MRVIGGEAWNFSALMEKFRFARQFSPLSSSNACRRENSRVFSHFNRTADTLLEIITRAFAGTRATEWKVVEGCSKRFDAFFPEAAKTGDKISEIYEGTYKSRGSMTYGGCGEVDNIGSIQLQVHQSTLLDASRRGEYLFSKLIFRKIYIKR